MTVSGDDSDRLEAVTDQDLLQRLAHIWTADPWVDHEALFASGRGDYPAIGAEHFGWESVDDHWLRLLGLDFSDERV
ncbi:hypothetical protein GALL_414960 [mine drainage metagenome]|uniref:Uncharacterized protein n=1 Tax=mine drainage metagenome TaxID=410659 RepID=A0A1J5Q0L5_9ZZZZ